MRSRAKRHVAHQAAAHRLCKEVAKLLAPCRLGVRRHLLRRLDGEFPVLAHHGFARPLQVHRHRVPAGKPLHGLVERARRRDESVGEELLQRAPVDASLDTGMAKQPRKLGGEREEPGPCAVVKRLLAEAVAREEEAAVRGVVHREGEHAVQAAGQLRTPFLIAVDQHLGVGMVGPERVALRGELGAQLHVVVDFTVEDHADGARLVPHRLLAGGQVDDGEAPVQQVHAGRGVDVDALAVGAAVGDGAAHLAQDRLGPLPHESRDAAHVRSVRGPGWRCCARRRRPCPATRSTCA